MDGTFPGRFPWTSPTACTHTIYNYSATKLNIILYYNMGLRKPRERAEFDQEHLSEIVTYSFKGIHWIQEQVRLHITRFSNLRKAPLRP